MDHLISPHGGTLVDLLAGDARARDELPAASKDFPSWNCTLRQLCDLEMLMDGSFSPLRGFMARADYEAVCRTMRLADGTLWPMPVTLDVTEELAAGLAPGSNVALRDPEGAMLAVLEVEDVWAPDRTEEAVAVLGTDNPEHPGVEYLLTRAHPIRVGGTVVGVERPRHYDYRSLRPTPAELRTEFARLGWRTVVAFQTRSPMHRAHYELTLRAAKQLEANLLIHAVVGMTQPGDVDHYTRVRGYRAILGRYPEQTARLALLPLAMRMGGPREAVWHAIIHKNYGCTHLIVGRDHAGPGVDSSGKPFYGPYDAQDLLRRHEDELGVSMAPFEGMVYVEDLDEYLARSEVPEGRRTLGISGTELRRRLAEGHEIPSWFSFPEVIAEIRRREPPKSERGFTVFFTGLSGAGKSTIANVLRVKLLETGSRPVTLLDGDVVRKHLSSELGFSREHRDLNIRRIGYVASEITKNGGIAICAPIAPYDATRKEVRSVIERLGGFVLVHVATSIEECERRDRKGLYAKARAGILKEFTGISDPYEEPKDSEVVIQTEDRTPEEAANQILLHLEREGYVGGNVPSRLL